MNRQINVENGIHAGPSLDGEMDGHIVSTEETKVKRSKWRSRRAVLVFDDIVSVVPRSKWRVYRWWDSQLILAFVTISLISLGLAMVSGSVSCIVISRGKVIVPFFVNMWLSRGKKWTQAKDLHQLEFLSVRIVIRFGISRREKMKISVNAVDGEFVLMIKSDVKLANVLNVFGSTMSNGTAQMLRTNTIQITFGQDFVLDRIQFFVFQWAQLNRSPRV
jgi:hypothetical protein